MGSNDQWPPVASPSAGKSHGRGKSNANKKKDHQQMVLDLVTEMFATTLEQEVILSLAQNCDWELQSTIDALIALSSTVETPIMNEQYRHHHHHHHRHQTTTDHLSDELLKMNQTELKQQLEGFTKFEQLKKNSTKNRMDSFRGNIAKLDTFSSHAQTNIDKKPIPSSPWHSVSNPNKRDKAKVWENSEVTFPSNSFTRNYQNESNKCSNVSRSSSCKTLQATDSPSTTTIRPNPLHLYQTPKTSSEYHMNSNKSASARQLCGLQVHYRSPGTECSSDDDDADVVIEEEFNDCGIPTEIAVNVSQFLSASVQTSPPSIQSYKTQLTTTDSPPSTPHRTIYNMTLDRIKTAINKGDKILIILRGLPGCGKSTLAKSIITMTNCKGDASLYIFSSDNYFRMNKRGIYKYDPMKLSEAHTSNHQRVFKALESCVSPVIIDNTNLQAWEMRPYASMAVERGYCIEVLDVNTPWANNINELTKKNSHGVMKDKIAKMQSRYERGITGQKLLELYSLKYPTDIITAKVGMDNKMDVLTAEDMAILQNINDIPNIVHDNDNDNDNSSENNLNNGENGSNILLDYLRDLTSDEADINYQQKKVVVNVTNNVSEQQEQVMRVTSEEGNHLLQPLGAIGSERKNSLVHSEIIGLSRDINSNTSCESKENVLLQCWDFVILLNGKTLHSDHYHDEYYYSRNSLESPINADEMRKQDKEFGKEEQSMTISSSLLTTPIVNLSYIDDKNFESNNMNEFFKVLTKEYNDAIASFEQKKSTVIITEITEDISRCGVESEQPLKDTRMHYYNNITQMSFDTDIEQYRQVPHTILVSIQEMKGKNGDHLKMLLTNKKVKLKCMGSVEVNDLNFISARVDDEITEIIVNKGFEEMPVKSTFGTILDMIKISISEINNKDEESLEINDETVYIDKILQVPTFEMCVAKFDTKVANKVEWREMSANYTDFVTDISATISMNQHEYCPKTPNRFMLMDNTISQCEQPAKSNEQIHGINTIINCTSIPENDVQHEKLDNINRISWKESPFPIDDMSIAKLDSKIDIIPGNVSTADACTNTTYYDLNVAYIGGTSEPGYRVIDAFSRYICEGLPIIKLKPPPYKLMLDKSSMTGDIFNREGNPDLKDDDDNVDRIPKLIELFPHIPRECLIEIYEKLCRKDFEWTVEVLLEGVPNDISIELSEKTEKIDCKVSTQSVHESNEPSNTSLEFHEDADCCINDHLGDIELSKYQGHQQQYHGDNHELETNEQFLSNVEYLEQLKTNISHDRSLHSTVLDDLSELADNEKITESEEIIELNLGCEFLHTLENQFGNPDFHIPDGFQPIISVKKSIAQQLYTLWIESMYQQLNVRHEQLDEMIAKDAEFARSLERELELEEGRASSSAQSSVPNLAEIMDMELALASYNKELKTILAEAIPDDMASRLSRQMLNESMPDMDPKMFNEILKAHNGNFKETFDIIEFNTGRSITPCDALKKSTNNNFLEQMEKENIHDNEDKIKSKSNTSIIAVKSDLKFGDKSPCKSAFTRAANSRKEAQRQFSLRIYNFNKAAEAYKRGYPQVAAYYSQVARFHSNNIDTANADAASALLEGQILGDNENTLDLHYLFVTEALQALDEFLDYHLNKLAKSNRKKTSTVYIITGRGARSNNGTSKIKPAVSKRLITRNIRFSEENLGCLKVYLYRKNGTSD